MSDDREEFFAKYGHPERLADRETNVLVFLHSSQESAEVSAQRNRDIYGHPCHVELAGEGWITVVDLRPAVAEFALDGKRVNLDREN